jgi:hypothetical protein
MKNLCSIPLVLILFIVLPALKAQKLYVIDDGEPRSTEGENILLASASDLKIFQITDENEVEITNEDRLDISDGFSLMMTGADENQGLVEIALYSANGYYLQMNQSNGDVSLASGYGKACRYYAQNAVKGQAGQYKLYNQFYGGYLRLGSGGVLETTGDAYYATNFAFVAAERQEQVDQCAYRMDSPSQMTVMLETVSEYKAANRTGSPRCPSGSRFDLIDGGTCWTCPDGYNRTVFAVNSSNACERPASSKFVAANDRGKGTGIFGTDCPGGAKWDPNGRCYSCPSGYRRTVHPVTGGSACEKVIPASTSGASKVGDCKCSSGSFFDLYDGGTCWTCPSGYSRTVLYPVYSEKACQLN